MNDASPPEARRPSEGDVVLITRGEHKGRIGTLDDFENRQAVIYFGTITRSVGYYAIGMKSFRTATMHDLLARNDDILKMTFLQSMDASDPEHTSLLYERLLILDTIYDRHMSFLVPTLAKKDVFFAFCGSDRTLVKCACADLSELGHRVWFYEADPSDGASFIARMNQGIAEASRMVVFLSNAALKSPGVELEWTSALARRLNTPQFGIIPAIIEDCTIPPLLAGFPFADFKDDYLEGLSAVARILAGSTAE